MSRNKRRNQKYDQGTMCYEKTLGYLGKKQMNRYVGTKKLHNS